ncbi:MAG: primosomal protein N' [Gallionellaceae bacterium]
MPIIRVALDVPLSTLFDYFIGANLSVEVGQRVLVPFGRKQMIGVVMELAETSELAAERVKPVQEVMHDMSPLPSELITLLRFCSDYYQYPLGMTIMSALPARLRAQQPLVIKQDLYYRLSKPGQEVDLEKLPKRGAVKLRMLQSLKNAPMSSAQLRALSASAPAVLKALLEAGWVECCEVGAPVPAEHTFNEVHTPTFAQQQVIDEMTHSEGYRCFLLHGITGSGKTEVYVQLMHHTLLRGQQVLLLVPEINLTPQLENYFRSRFPDVELVSLHSGLNDGERARNWLRSQSGQARIVLGTRLSVFTPLPQLGLILVDEEHDSSYKQQDGLRYSARDVAIFRANQRKVPIVLGSATPSLESYYNAQTGRYQMLKLTQRASAEARLPQLHCLNISRIPLKDGISPAMLAALELRLHRKEQSLIFINRRGYAPVLMCGACGWVSGCKKCAGKLVLHLQERILRCHHCGHQERVPRACPECGNTDLQPVGIGTQRIEEALQAHFPEARIMRVDRDSTRNKNAWSAMRKQIQDDAVDIMVGTQILAKGHDFPNLTLVGVLNPDGALYSADFRASEKLFAQLAQVAGRAGRAEKPGEVLMQTFFPDHPIFRALRAHDYDAWAQILLSERRQAGFPPFVFQVLLRAEGLNDSEVYSFLKRGREAAMALSMPVEIYGVVAASMPKRANHIRAQLLVQSETRKELQQFLRAWRPLLEQLPATKLRWSLDIDPIEF